MIDDLVTRGVDDPYRVFTSRAEHRLTLRESNSEDRLSDLAFDIGLIGTERYRKVLARRWARTWIRTYLSRTTLGPELAERLGIDVVTGSRQTRLEILKRPGVPAEELFPDVTWRSLVQWVAEDIRYSGYIEREAREIERLRDLEELRIPAGMDFGGIPGLSAELTMKLEKVRPLTLGQARRIPGMTPAALAVLRVRARGK
jgi:tRNA uridine 5-carboxymethylaminomethyl modification enzyme